MSHSGAAAFQASSANTGTKRLDLLLQIVIQIGKARRCGEKYVLNPDEGVDHVPVEVAAATGDDDQRSLVARRRRHHDPQAFFRLNGTDGRRLARRRGRWNDVRRPLAGALGWCFNYYTDSRLAMLAGKSRIKAWRPTVREATSPSSSTAKAVRTPFAWSGSLQHLKGEDHVHVTDRCCHAVPGRQWCTG